MQIIHIDAAKAGPVIPLGKQGENEARAIAFDVSAFLAMWPGASVALAVVPPSGSAYPAVVSTEDGVTTWVVKSSDTAYSGMGKAELRILQGDVIKKSVTYLTNIIESFTATGTAPDPVSDWIEDAEAKLGEVESATQAANDAAGMIDDKTVAASGLAAGSDPTATISEVSGHKHIAFGIPAGQTGPAGTNGTDGKDGADGVSPAVSISPITGGHSVTITDKGHPSGQSFDVLDGEQGDPGPGVPSGGTDGQMLVKDGSTDYATKWANAPSAPVQDVQVNGTSILNNGIANVPAGDANNFGVVKIGNGLKIDTSLFNKLATDPASEAQIKAGAAYYNPVTPTNQHRTVFYGLAKAAGDSTQSASSNVVGTYTETARSKISDMLNAPVSVSGSTPSITALAGVRYVCGEVSTLAIALPASGDVEVIFESGSTATVLTVTPPSGVTAIKWPGWFDPTDLDANAVYDMIFTNGELAVVTSWT